jgi:hypothetical protein
VVDISDEIRLQTPQKLTSTSAKKQAALREFIAVRRIISACAYIHIGARSALVRTVVGMVILCITYNRPWAILFVS